MPVGSDWRTAVLNSEHLVSVCLIFVHLTERLLGDLLVLCGPDVYKRQESYFFGHADGRSIGIRLWESGKTG